ncbi:hypothetical protein ACFLWS_08685 [Chloroflexota bacterium]
MIGRIIANQEQRNKLANVLFEGIKLDSGGKVVAVKPRMEFEPFFRLSYECHARDIAGAPGGHWVLKCNWPIWWKSYVPRLRTSVLHDWAYILRYGEKSLRSENPILLER